jgi:hypothetical protein
MVVRDRVKERTMSQWTVLVPLEAIKKSDPTMNIFIEPGNVLEGIEVPEKPLTSNDPRIAFTCAGEEYTSERLDLEVCARPTTLVPIP